MADERLLPPGIRDERFRAFLALLERWDDIDLLPLLPNRVDTVPAALLYPLAWQFGVTGLAGWDTADTDAKRRELIRRAVELHRRRGTPWAIREAFRAVGFSRLYIDEYDGRAVADGSLSANGEVYASTRGIWAHFAVIVGEAGDGRPVTGAVRKLLRGIVETWKPVRSRLVDMRYRVYRADGNYRADGTAIAAGTDQ